MAHYLDSSSNGVRPMDDSKLSYLREMCDEYFDPSICDLGAASTRFHIDGIEHANPWAELVLKAYNEKEQKNFYLEKVAKVNVFVTFHFLTFWARTAESAEGLLFRGVVDLLTREIKLCEIKGGDEIAIPVDHSEKCSLQRSRSTYYLRNSSSGGSVAAISPSHLGHGCADPRKVDGFCPLGHSMLQALRDLCDTYFDPRDRDPGAGISHICFDRTEEVNYYLAELALELYNEKEQKSFYLEEICKLNVFFAYYCLTFWARTPESHDHSLFRGVVHVMGGDKAVLCEIKDDGEITIPVDHSENCRLKRSRIDDDEAKDTTDGSVVASSGAAVGCGGVDLDKMDGVRPMGDSTFSSLRELCDKYFDPCDCSPGAGITRFHIPGIEFVNELAESTLEFYNQKDKKKFYLEEVCQLNLIVTYYCLTFWARAAGSDERRLFRGVVDVLGGVTVVLCEIKDGDAITSPVDSSENCSLKRSRINDYDANDTAVGSVDASSGEIVARGGVELDRVDGVRPMDDSKLSYLREMCDEYFDPSICDLGAASTRFHIDGIEHANPWAELVLKAYNEKEQKNFYLEKVAKLNVFVTFHFLTFWARTAESAEGFLFRGVVDLLTREIKLCEIKGGDEIAIPVDHSEKCRLQRSRCNYILRNSSADGSVAAISASNFGHGCVYLDKVEGFCPMGHSMLWALRDLCDTYFGLCDCGLGACISHMLFDAFEEVYFAELALEFYNEKENKSFYLEEFGNLNVFFAYCCFTFWAWTAESDECSLFRGVVHVMNGYKVVLCEIKDDGEITIPVDHSENCRLKHSRRIHDYEANDITGDSVDASSGVAVGHGYLDTCMVDGFIAINDSELPLLREMCDKYFDPRDRFLGAGITRFHIDGIEYVNEFAESALECYNQTEKKKFYFEKVVKLNLFVTYYCLTFWAQTAESDERCLFRGVVDVLGGVTVVLCEIKDGDSDYESS